MQEPTQKEKKEPRRLFEVLTIIVAVLVAGTTLWSNREKVPELWFNTTLIVLVVIVAVMMLDRTSSFWLNRLREGRKKRERNRIARKYFAEFKDLVDGFRSASYGIFSVLQNLRGHFEPKIREKMGLLPLYLLQVHNRNDVESPLNSLKRKFDEGNETFRELTLLIDQFNIILEICEKMLKLMFEFQREIKKEYKMPERIETEYEEFREKYNDFIKYYKRYCHKLNQELGESVFSEHFDLAKKW